MLGVGKCGHGQVKKTNQDAVHAAGVTDLIWGVVSEGVREEKLPHNKSRFYILLSSSIF